MEFVDDHDVTTVQQHLQGTVAHGIPWYPGIQPGALFYAEAPSLTCNSCYLAVTIVAVDHYLMPVRNCDGPTNVGPVGVETYPNITRMQNVAEGTAQNTLQK